MKQKNENNYYQILDDFRQNYPLQEITLHSQLWTYYAVGDSQNDALLLLQGGGADAEAMFRYIEGFAEHFYVIAPNIPSEIHTLADAIAGLHALLAHEHILQVHLVGISFGAILAQCYIRAFMDTVQNMIITHTLIPSEYLTEPTKMQKNLIMIYPASLLLWFSKRAYNHAITKSSTPASPAQRQFWQAYFEDIYSTKISKEHLLSRARMTTDYHLNHKFQSDDLKLWNGNLLIIESSEDDVISEGNRGSLLGMYPRAYVQTLYGYDHLAPFLAGEEMLDSMRNFLLEVKGER